MLGENDQGSRKMNSVPPGARLLSVLVALVFVSPLLAQFGGGGFGGGGGGFGGGGAGGGQPGPPGPQKAKRYVPAQFAPTGPQIPVVAVRIRGINPQDQSRVLSRLRTREGRPFDPQTIQADVRALLTSGLYFDVKPYHEESPEGIAITFELSPRPTMDRIQFVGASVRERTLLKKAELNLGEPLSRYRLEEAKRKLEEFYHTRGNSQVSIEIREGLGDQDRGVTFSITEGPRQRVYRTSFEGNSFVSDARLKTQIKSKPGILWYFKGEVDTDQIEEDMERLTAYYRSFGYFRAKIGRELEYDDDNEWLTLTFVIDEGPRYVIRRMSIAGNQVFETQDLSSRLELKEGDFFDLATMNRDVSELRDIYGAQGYIFADVVADPRFLEEPGQLDLVYQITEGKQYRVGDIKVNIGGDFPHTQHIVVHNYLDLSPGDIVDIRKVRNSERRIKASQLFDAPDPIAGPQIILKPREIDDEMIASPLNDSPGSKRR